VGRLTLKVLLSFAQFERELIDALTHQRIGLDEPNTRPRAVRTNPGRRLKGGGPSEINEIALRAGYRARFRRRTPGTFPQNTVVLIKTFAAQSVVAIQNARLFDNVETRTRELVKSLEDPRTAQDRLVKTEKLASLSQLTAVSPTRSRIRSTAPFAGRRLNRWLAN
jgi:hypothetical protein